MFTGIVEELGHVQSLVSQRNLSVLKVQARQTVKGIRLGDSVSVNGVCLTVVKKDKEWLTFDLMRETLLKTNLKDLKTRQAVNLERAMKFNDRLGGHVVTGHVDCVGRIQDIVKQENYVEFIITLDKNLKYYIVAKGSVCIDGVSLTVGKVSGKNFSVYLIPFTLQRTTFGMKTIGDRVNIEADVLAKYAVHSAKLKSQERGLK